MTTLSAFRSVRVVGSVLPADALARAAERKMPGQTAENYELTPGMTVNAAIARAWEACLGAYRAWHAALDRLRPGDPATGLTRDKWLLPLLYELGYGRPEKLNSGIETPPGVGETEPRLFPISHRVSWSDNAGDPGVDLMLHLLGAGVGLDTKTANVTARAPQSMLQDFLNRSPRHLWGIVTNGRLLRVLRDASSLTRQSYIEFDLDDMFDNQRYADFRLFFLTIHASRFAPVAPERPIEDDEENGSPALSPESCRLEQWRKTAISDGARALAALRDSVARALEHLGSGFVSHPANRSLRATLATAPDADTDLHKILLRVAYRLIVLFVVEDRELLHAAEADLDARTRYHDYFSTARLRRLATTRTGGRHTDLWEAHLIVTDALAGNGLDVLALPGLASSLFARDYLGMLTDAKLSNRSLLDAVKALAEITDSTTGVTRPVDYRNLDSEELGGVYEGLLAYVPRYDAAARTFTFEVAKGSARKKSGSYYTPSDLIRLVLDEALDPLIADARDALDPEAALLKLTVVDPAVGSGHFVVAAARRIGIALAQVRTGELEPSQQAIRTAVADVISQCVYGVDINDLAIEITKVALWLEAFDGSRPLPFLDAHFKVGNALLGTTPKLLAEGVPDSAFLALGDDDKTWTSKLKARNKAERKREGQLKAHEVEGFKESTSRLADQAREIDHGTPRTPEQVKARADAWRRFESDPNLGARKLAADAWCTAFVQAKSPEHGSGITHDTVRRIAEDPANASADAIAMIRGLAREYRFFHWHLEFPTIFTVPEPDTGRINPDTGWQGGFSCVIGNPPWERVKIQDKEFFAAVGRDDIANAKTAAIRTGMIEDLRDEDPTLHSAYLDALRHSDSTAHVLLRSGRYPLTGRGDVNTYSVFAETFRDLLAPHGTTGVITPTGLATDKTTAPFFANSLEEKRLLTFYDFENEAKIFPEVHHSYRFAVTVLSGPDRPAYATRFAFLTRHLIEVPGRRFELSPEEVMTLNPNTGTLPMFRTRTDAEITLDIYRRHPVLIRDGIDGHNHWQLSFGTLFHMANDSDLFAERKDLPEDGFNGWSYDVGTTEYVPLYEAKMISHFDHRFSTYQGATQEQLNVGTLPRLTRQQHDDPDMEPSARYWVPRAALTEELSGKWNKGWILGWRDIARSSDARTFTPSVLPTSAVGDSFLLAFPKKPSHGPLLHAIWSSMAFDFVARQKLSGTHMKFFTTKQLACLTPATFDQPTPWQQQSKLTDWLKSYILELSYTSWRLQPYAEEMRYYGAPFRWDQERRALLRADMDAAFLHLFGVSRINAEHILNSFPVIQKYDQREHGEFRTRRLVLTAYDRMADAIRNQGTGWSPLSSIPAGQGERHRMHN